MCPWCYLGELRLEAALAGRPRLQVERRWWPFQLNPHMPVGGMDRRAYLERKFGGAEGAARVYGAIDAAGTADGVGWRLDRIARTPNTLDSHRLVLWAGAAGRQRAVIHGLFRAFFHQGLDIGDREVLARVAVAAGLGGDAAREFLAGTEAAESVRERDREARTLGVSGVPCLRIDGRIMVTGAQPPAVLLECLDRLAPQQGMP